MREKVIESNERLLVLPAHPPLPYILCLLISFFLSFFLVFYKILKKGHTDLRRGVNYTLQAFRAELADFSANLPKLLEISPSHSPTPSNHPPSSHHPTSPNHPPSSYHPSSANNHSFSDPAPPSHQPPSPQHHPANPDRSSAYYQPTPSIPYSSPHFIPNFYTPIPPHSPAPPPSNFYSSSNMQHQLYNETSKNSEAAENLYNSINSTNPNLSKDFNNNNNNDTSNFESYPTTSKQGDVQRYLSLSRLVL